MIKFEGRLLNLDHVDICGRKWAKDCEISFPDKVPVLDNFRLDIPPLGNAEISEDDDGLSCIVMLPDAFALSDEYYVGGLYHDVEHHTEVSIEVIDSCRLTGVSLVPEDRTADPDLKIRRVEND